MKLLFRGETLCSDEPKCSRDLSFSDFLIDTKIKAHKMYIDYGFRFELINFWQNKRT